MKTAGNAVKQATQMLVDSAKEAAFDDAEEESVVIPGGMVQSILRRRCKPWKLFLQKKEN